MFFSSTPVLQYSSTLLLRHAGPGFAATSGRSSAVDPNLSADLFQRRFPQETAEGLDVKNLTLVPMRKTVWDFKRCLCQRRGTLQMKLATLCISMFFVAFSAAGLHSDQSAVAYPAGVLLEQVVKCEPDGCLENFWQDLDGDGKPEVISTYRVKKNGEMRFVSQKQLAARLWTSPIVRLPE